jgi:hypothetical protein
MVIDFVHSDEPTPLAYSLVCRLWIVTICIHLFRQLTFFSMGYKETGARYMARNESVRRAALLTLEQ